MISKFNSFLKNTCGGTMAIFAFSSVPILVSAGSAVDFMRRNDARETLVAIVDEAVLAGAQAFVENGGNKPKAEAVAEKHFAQAVAVEQFPWNLNVSFKVKPDGSAMQGLGTATLDTSIMNLMGVETMQLYPMGEANTAEALIGGGSAGGDIEVAVMLDMTGSMCADGDGPCTSGTKISALKTAAKDLIDKVVADDQSKYTSRVALIPFSTRVRLGPDGGGGGAMLTLTGMPATWSGFIRECTAGVSSGGGSESGETWNCTTSLTYPVTNWKIKPCISDRHTYVPDEFQYSDNMAGSNEWFNAHEGSRNPVSHDSSDNNPSFTGTSASDPVEDWNYSDSGQCYDVHENNQIQGLSDNKDQLKQKIDGLVAHGATAGVLGTNVTWGALSPKWSSFWGADSSPGSYEYLTQTNESGNPKLRKIAILMSDGAYNTYRAWKDQDREEISEAAVRMCDAMKATGIEVFTVGYDLDNLSALDQSYANNTLQACGTDLSHFYNSLNSNDIKEHFEDIAANLGGSGSVRLVK